MSIGKFNETGENDNEVNETKEAADNTEKPRNQILETPDSYKDDFDSKLDNKESCQSQEINQPEKNDDYGENTDNTSEEKTSLLEKMKNIFNEKDAKDNQTLESTENKEKSSVESFKDSLKVSPEDMQKVGEENDVYAKPSESKSDANEGDEHGEDGEKTHYSDRFGGLEH